MGPLTSASIARDHFLGELKAHQDESGPANNSTTLVILQDSCYGHRYSRPRTSKASLNTIVERPERIHASVLGLAAAYVRLGGRHADGPVAPHPKRTEHTSYVPFRIHKTNRTMSLDALATTNVHGAQWMQDLSTMCEAAEAMLAQNGKELTRPTALESAAGKDAADKPKLHEGDLYLCSGSLGALKGSLGGVCEAVDHVFNGSSTKRAFVCIRPPGHHCSADFPSGFCWLNNVHVGISYATVSHGLTHAAIIDFDLHHGDGSQSITWAHNARMAALPKNISSSKKTSIGYFSLHDINSYPCEWGDEEKVRSASLCLENAHGQTIWNVHLQPWKTEAEFWELYETRYCALLDKARTFLRVHTQRLLAGSHTKPKAAIFLSAGFDASEWEGSGMQRHKVNVPTTFYARFTRDVVRLADEEGLGVEGRVISVLEGGYSDRALTSGVLSHLTGLTSLRADGRHVEAANGLGEEMGKRLGPLSLDDEPPPPTVIAHPLDQSWWALQQLEELERTVNPPPAPVNSKKTRPAAAPTYSSSTQSSTAKIVSPPQYRRSTSISSTNSLPRTVSSPRVPSPPPLSIDWATATHELSKLLIPSDRETRSCRPEDLNVEASRAKRDRVSSIGLPAESQVADGKRMQLRDRKAKPSHYTLGESSDEKPMSRVNRRKTIAVSGTFQKQPLREKPIRPANRRLSIASSVGSVNEQIPSSKIESNVAQALDHAANGSLSSAETVRPGSAASSWSQSSALPVKKTRAPSKTRIEAPKAVTANMLPPVPRVPSAYGATSTAISRSTSVAPANGLDLKSQDVDSLASGMKKMSINLKMPAKEIQAVKETKPKPPAVRGRPKSIAPKATKAKPTKKPILEPPRNVIDTNAPLPIQETATEAPMVPLKFEDTTATLDLPLNFQRNEHIPTQTEHGEAEEKPHEAQTPSTPLRLIPLSPTPINIPTTEPTNTPPITSPDPCINTIQDSQPPQSASNPLPTSPPKRTKQDLPIFTSTSPIRFGLPKPEPTSIEETLSFAGTANAPTTDHSGDTRAQTPTQDMWEVPDTPQHRMG